jgi:mRNA interferase YafQ
MKYRFRPRATFERGLKYLARLDPTVIGEVRDAIQILLNGGQLDDIYRDHELKRKYAGYREFHLRDTPKGEQPNETNDVLVVYKIKEQDLVLVAVNIGSHQKLFNGQYRSKK